MNINGKKQGIIISKWRLTDVYKTENLEGLSLAVVFCGSKEFFGDSLFKQSQGEAGISLILCIYFQMCVLAIAKFCIHTV